MSRNLSDIDGRSRRTRNALAGALMRLSRQVSVDRISVARLAAEAGVGRSTFYAHFSGMPDFLRASYANMLERSALRAQTETGPSAVLPGRLILQHMSSSGRFGTIIRQSREWPAIIAAGRQRLGRVVEANLAHVSPGADPRTRRWAAVFITGAFMAMLEQWTESGRSDDPETLDARFQLFLDGVLRSLVEPVSFDARK
jgi:AcrR family transcriptional regulator